MIYQFRSDCCLLYTYMDYQNETFGMLNSWVITAKKKHAMLNIQATSVIWTIQFIKTFKINILYFLLTH